MAAYHLGPAGLPSSAMNIENLTPFAVANAFGRTVRGEEALLLFIKGTFSWADDGVLRPVEDAPPLIEADEFTGEAGKSSLKFAGETAPPKPMIDFYLTGLLRLAEARAVVDCSVQIGNRLRKAVRVYGPRSWCKTNNDGKFTASAPQSFVEMPLQWEFAYGGVSPSNLKLFEPRNPVGVGLCDAKQAEGQPLPNFEAPGAPTTLEAPSAPIGFGAVSPHWHPRAQYAGTYDAAWQSQRAPLLPSDFNQRFHNVAPEDQQLPAYPEGEVVTLVNLTPKRQESFALPPFRFPVFLVDDGYLVERTAEPDTVVVDLEKRTVSVRAAIEYVPRATLLDLARAFVGPVTAARRKALLTGKTYARLRECRGKK